MNRYTPGLLDWVKAHYKEYDVRDLTEQINEHSKTNMTEVQVKSLKGRYHLTGAPQKKIYSDTFPREVCDFIRANYKDTGHKAMAELLKEHFGRTYTDIQIKAFYRNNHLNCGHTGQFQKGGVAHNKGKKMSPEQYAKASATMFKPGNRPHNAMKVGSRVQTEDGYWKTKVAEPDVWEFDHRRIWQQTYGPIPEGMIVSFRDSNKDNLDPKNLMLITRDENWWLAKNNLRSHNPEITDAALNVAKLIAKTREVRKHGNDKQ